NQSCGSTIVQSARTRSQAPKTTSMIVITRRLGAPMNRSMISLTRDAAARVMRERHHGELRVHSETAGDDAGVTHEQVGGAVHAEIAIDDALARRRAHRIAALRMPGAECDVALVLHDLRNFTSEVIRVGELMVFPAVHHHACCACCEQDLAELDDAIAE